MAATPRSASTRTGPGVAGDRPAVADPGRCGPPPGFEAVDADTLVMEAAPGAPEAQALSRALDWAGLAAAVRAPEAVPTPEGGFRAPRPEAVSVTLRIARPAGRDAVRTVPADLALASAPGPWAGDARALVTPASDLTPGTPARLLRAAFFRPCGGGAGRGLQRRRFAEDALRAARMALACEDGARRQAIADALSREVLWLFPDDRQVVVTVRGGRVTVDLGPALSRPPLVKEDRP